MIKMKKVAAAAVLGLALLGAGCSHQEMDVAKIQSSLAAVPSVDKSELESGVAAVNAGQYTKAIGSFQKIAYGPGLNLEQKQLLRDFVTQLQTKAAGK